MVTRDKKWMKKIYDNNLRAFVSSNRKDKISVLIEIDAIEPTVDITLPVFPESNRVRPNRIHHSREQQETEKTAIEKTMMLLNSLGLKGHFLRSARIFIIKATPSQLRHLGKSPFVRSIIPNRSVKH